MLRYIDPMSGKQKSKSAGTADRSDAEKAAGKWEDQLREGRYRPGSKLAWSDFRQRYDDEALDGLADATARKVLGIFNSIESILSPHRLRDLTESRISFYQSELRRLGKSENTIKGHLAHLKSALRWAERVGMLPKAPRIAMPKRAKGAKRSDTMKGRPITGEEFDRMLAKVKGIVGKQATNSWKHYLRGLWLSGLRLAESLELYWDRDDRLCVDLSGKHPMLRIPAGLEKGNRDRLLPMAPEFAEFLLTTPKAKRHGPVFMPKAFNDGKGKPGRKVARVGVDRACHIVSMIGKAAGIKVLSKTVGDVEQVKFATAHDLRRSFGERWATRVMPTVLMELMRHESIETTLRFYVGQNAQNTAKTLWDAHKAAGNTFGNTPAAGVVKAQSHDATTTDAATLS